MEKLIYVLVEQALNGTVTMDTIITGVEAHSFDEACEKVTKFENWSKAINIERTDGCLSYIMPGTFSVWGRMESKPLTIR
jgi:hypothetical protein